MELSLAVILSKQEPILMTMDATTTMIGLLAMPQWPFNKSMRPVPQYLDDCQMIPSSAQQFKGPTGVTLNFFTQYQINWIMIINYVPCWWHLILIFSGGNFDYGSNNRETHSIAQPALENSEGMIYLNVLTWLINNSSKKFVIWRNFSVFCKELDVNYCFWNFTN